MKNYGVHSDLIKFSTLKTICVKSFVNLRIELLQKDRVASEVKNNIVYEVNCSNREAVYFGESKRSLKSRSNKRKKSVRNCDCGKNEIAKHCWETNHNFSWDQRKGK